MSLSSLGRRLTADAHVLSAVGHIRADGIAPDGLVMLVKDSPDFIADSVREIGLNDRVIFDCSSNSLVIAHARGKWVIHNRGKEPVAARLVLAGVLAPTAGLHGYLVRAARRTQAPVELTDAGAVVSLGIPAEECSVLR